MKLFNTPLREAKKDLKAIERLKTLDYSNDFERKVINASLEILEANIKDRIARLLHNNNTKHFNY